ncbi:hypothetical protein ANCCAN_18954 [Ancylostoma caninum]|uniref:Uncharacterized protein n=1 Tax=Ancylostoma caninum TaxID=29170 RepID=A0A368FWL7_ANCCA|nr:hypothetical protein ANCCAN_18954 [Ancylostoma caninum]
MSQKYLLLGIVTITLFYFVFISSNNYFKWIYMIQLTLPSEPQVYKDILDEIDLDCKKIVEGDRNAIEQAKEWTYDTMPIEELLFSADDR